MRFILIVFGVSAVLIFGFAFFQHSPPRAVISDVLSSENLIPDINAARRENGHSMLVEDAELTNQANNDSAKAATSSTLILTSNELTDRYITLTGDHYSAKGLVSEWMSDPVKRKFLLKNGNRIGAWISYLIPSSNQKPIPYIAVIIQ